MRPPLEPTLHKLVGLKRIDLIGECTTVHVSFKRAIIKYVLENFPAEFAARSRSLPGPRHYNHDVYRRVGLE